MMSSDSGGGGGIVTICQPFAAADGASEGALRRTALKHPANGALSARASTATFTPTPTPTSQQQQQHHQQQALQQANASARSLISHSSGPSGQGLPSSLETPDGALLQQDGSVVGARRHRKRCCSKRLRKLLLGVWVSVAMAASWVGATHFIKRTFLYRESEGGNITIVSPYAKATTKDTMYDAPFFTTWFCTLWSGIFFPMYLVVRCTCCRYEKMSFKSICSDSVRTFQEKGLSFGKVFCRVAIFCALWVVTNYMYVQALRVLDATDVMALYSSSISFFYLLSWVILHEQFVGVRIVAVILCNTGIALLAYMDGLTRAPTLGGVILAAASSAGSAVYKVLFKKVIGDASYGQVALFFSLISAFNTLLLWPLLVLFYFASLEVIRWPHIPWCDLMAAAGLTLASNLIGNFGVAVTYETFITLGLIIAVPVSAAVDTRLYQVKFEGMKLAGIILISIGFLLVLFPENWPDYITRLLRWRRTHHAHDDPPRTDTCTGGARSRLRSPSGLVR